MSRPLLSRAAIDRFDRTVIRHLQKHGERVERWGLALVFVWFGALKVLGYSSATSIIAEAVYFGSPKVTVPFLGAWEVAIGICFLFRPLLRIAILLLLVRLPGTVLALALKHDQCFVGTWMVPSIQGQYLIKDAALFGAALVLGAQLRLTSR